MTDMVFNQPQLITNDHDWVQRGYMIEDACNPSRPECHNGGIPIPSGKLLVKDQKGGYDLIDETDTAHPLRQRPAATDQKQG